MALAACSLVFPFDDYGPGNPGSNPDSGDTGPGPATDANDAFVPGCPLDHAPDPPSADDPGGADTDITLAVSTLVIGVGTATTPGLDLDGLCSCPDVPPCTSKEKHCDREGGIDNGFDELAARFSAFGAPVRQDRVQSSLDSGSTTILVALHRYNGLANDTNVDVGLFASLGTTPMDDAGTPTPPKKDGNDVWTIDPGSVANSNPPYVPKAIATSAWVKNGVLVARVDLTLQLAGNDALPIELHEATVTGRLSKAGGLWRLDDGRLAGRWRSSSFLSALAGVHDPADKTKFLCGDSGTYAVYKPQVCAALDIRGSGSEDGTSKTCDALSVGAGFAAIQAKLGPLGPVTTRPTGCGGSWKDDCGN